MEYKEFITVQEFSELAGVSPQAVYARFNSLDKSLTKTENKKKYISTDALGLFAKQTNKQDEVPDKALQLQLEHLREKVSMLEKQLEFSNNQLEIKDRQIESYINSIEKLTESNQILLSQAAASVSEDSPKTESAQRPAAGAPDSQEQKPIEPAEPQKKSFWTRLFNL